MVVVVFVVISMSVFVSVDVPVSVYVVVSRAVAPLQTLLELTLPLCRPGGKVVAMKGRKSESECARSSNALTELGGSIESVIRVKQFLSTSEGELVIVRKTTETSPVYPRRAGIPLKYPL